MRIPVIEITRILPCRATSERSGTQRYALPAPVMSFGNIVYGSPRANRLVPRASRPQSVSRTILRE
jgi:hypothetical protein